jgi:hypothetical protein
MVRAYINERATGGAVKPLPWRGLRGLGLRLKPLLMKKGLGLMEDGRACPAKKRTFPFGSFLKEHFGTIFAMQW